MKQFFKSREQARSFCKNNSLKQTCIMDAGKEANKNERWYIMTVQEKNVQEKENIVLVEDVNILQAKAISTTFSGTIIKKGEDGKTHTVVLYEGENCKLNLSLTDVLTLQRSLGGFIAKMTNCESTTFNFAWFKKPTLSLYKSKINNE